MRPRVDVPVPLVVLLVLVGLRAVLPDEPAFTFVDVVVPLWAMVSLAWRSRTRQGSDPTPWALLAVGSGFLAAAELSWWIGDVVGRDVYPSEADVLRALGVVCLIAALAVTASRLSTVSDPAGLIDVAAIGVAATSLAWLFVIEPAAASADVSAVEQSGLVITLILDIALLAVGMRLAFALRGRSSALTYLFLAIGVFVFVDVFDALLEVGTGIDLHQRVDAIALAGVGFLVLAAQPGPASLERGTQPDRFGRRRLVILAASAFTPLVVLSTQQLDGGFSGPQTTRVMVATSLAAAALVIARIGGLLGLVRQLTTAEGRRYFAALVTHSADAILALDESYEIGYASPSVAHVLGRSPESLIGARLTDVVLEDEVGPMAADLARAASSSSRSPVRFPTRMALPDGVIRDFETVAARLRRDSGGQGVVVTMRDVTTQLALERQLRAQAFNDELTGLANRALFYDRLGQALARRERVEGDEVAVLYVDLDQFKEVNDGLGHRAGDELLIAVAARLSECVRNGDTVARIGGDEFVILLESPTSEASASTTAERMLEVLNLPLRAGGLDLSVRASIGIALAGPDDSADDLVQAADIAMYRAKGSAAAKTCVFTPAMRTSVTHQLELRSDLEHALERGQLSLAYQPIVELATRRVVACEALVRWEHPERGWVSPEEFIPLAEQSRLISDIGRRVLLRACEDAAAWPDDAGPVGVAVNVSAVQFQDPGLLFDVGQALDASGLAPERLTVEITETAVMSDPAATEATLARLREVGVAVAVDDFGTGYCSLAYVKRFAPDKLKIDQSFVTEITDADQRDLLAHNIVGLAASLGIAAVAEGVETAAQAASLTAAGCALAQGYHFSRPLDLPALTALLTTTSVTPSVLVRTGPT